MRKFSLEVLIAVLLRRSIKGIHSSQETIFEFLLNFPFRGENVSKNNSFINRFNSELKSGYISENIQKPPEGFLIKIPLRIFSIIHHPSPPPVLQGPERHQIFWGVFYPSEGSKIS